MFPNAKAAIAASTESNIFKIPPFANQVGKFFGQFFAGYACKEC